ncbi:MAG: Type IIS restriction enzyme Eco57I [Candidatus Heimdallarchaeota archaeon AB_125]|nr:MAG: Type IIS restriction enzyme Eco57I [Candidatus Heimdallarchaeota archaeon AB_125]
MNYLDPDSVFFHKLASSSKGWFSILNKFIQKSNHTEQLISYCRTVLSEFDSYSSVDSQVALDPKNFSLNETHLVTLATPYHLSFYDKSSESNKQKGQFFTPWYISGFIASKTFDFFIQPYETFTIDSLLNQIRIADISVGTGNLLLPLLYRIIQDSLPLTEEQQILLHRFLETNLYGFDIDPHALFISKLRILLFSSLYLPNFDLPNLENNFCLGNSLLNKRISLSSDPAFKPVSYFKNSDSAKFDVIVSNPPYMAYGLREAQKYHPEFKKYLRDRFSSAEYKLSLYPIFIERSLELLKENGTLGIITPDSHLLGRYYSKIRSYILANSEILDISLLDFEPFTGVTIGRPTITFLKKTTEVSPDFDGLFIARWISSQQDFLDGIWDELGNEQQEFQSNEYNRFNLYFRIQDKEYVQGWINKCSLMMEDIVTVHTGVRSKIGQKKIISQQKESETWKRGIISGSQIKPFLLDYQNHWLNIDSSILWSGGFNPEIVEKPKIIMRQTGYNITAAVDTEGYYHLNNCHSVSPKDETTNLYALAAVLNSPEFNKIYGILSMEKGRALAQVDIEFLLKMHIPKLSVKTEKKLEELFFEQHELQQKNTKLQDYSLLDFLH